MLEYFYVKKPNIEEATVIRLAFYVNIFFFSFLTFLYMLVPSLWVRKLVSFYMI